MAFLGQGKEHWSQTAMLGLVAGSMLASATYFIVSHVDGVAQQDQMAIASMDRRVTTLETQHTADTETLNRLSTLVDQERAAENDLSLAIRSLQTVIENTSRPRR